MKTILRELITNKELSAAISEGKTLQKISDAIYAEHGLRFSTAAISKRCKVIGLKLPKSGPRSGSQHTGWKGGRILNKDGYYEIYSPDHPHRKKHTPYVLEHRLVMEEMIGRYLLPKEIVHHKNGDKTDNRKENLELFETNAEHLRVTLKNKIPNWTEQGKENMRKADRRKNGNNYLYSQEELLRRRARAIVASAIQSDLKLCALPNRKTIDDYLAQQGKDYQQVFDMELKRLQQPSS